MARISEVDKVINSVEICLREGQGRPRGTKDEAYLEGILIGILGLLKHGGGKRNAKRSGR